MLGSSPRSNAIGTASAHPPRSPPPRARRVGAACDARGPRRGRRGGARAAAPRRPVARAGPRRAAGRARPRSGLARGLQGEADRGRGEEREDADLHALQAPGQQREVEAGEGDGAEGGELRAFRHLKRDPPDEAERPEYAQRAGDLDRQTDDVSSDRQQMEERHVQHPQRVRIPLHSRSARVPHQTVALGQVPRVAHGDHAVVEEAEDAPITDEEAGVPDVQSAVDGAGEEEGEEAIGAEASGTRRGPWPQQGERAPEPHRLPSAPCLELREGSGATRSRVAITFVRGATHFAGEEAEPPVTRGARNPAAPGEAAGVRDDGRSDRAEREAGCRPWCSASSCCACALSGDGAARRGRGQPAEER